MQFDDFVREVDASIGSRATIERIDGQPRARWETRSRNAAIELVPPRNVSVTLAGSSESPATTWYPIDAALVGVVSRRIAAYLGEA